MSSRVSGPSRLSTRTNSLRMILAVAIGSVILVACGSDGGAEEDTVTADPTATAELVSTATPAAQPATATTAPAEPTATSPASPTPTKDPEPTPTTVVTEPATAVEDAATQEAETQGIRLRVLPEVGSRATLFFFLVEGLTPNERYLHVVIYPDGQEDVDEAVFDPEQLALVITSGELEGMPIEAWEVLPGDPLGKYLVELRHIDTGEVLASTSFTVE